MLKKTIVGLVLLMLSGTAFAGSLSLQAKASYFFPSDTYFKSIYGSAPTFGAKVAYDLAIGLGLWADVEFYSKTGTTDVTGDTSMAGETTKLRLVPVTAGVRYVFLPGGFVSPYLGAGIGLFQYKETNSIGTVSKSDIGFTAQAGVLVRLGRTVFVDLQGSYSSCKVNPAGVEAELGGIKAGLGLGVAF